LGSRGRRACRRYRTQVRVRVRFRVSVRVRFRVRIRVRDWDRGEGGHAGGTERMYYVMLCHGNPSTPVRAVFASRWPRVSASERHSVELQRHLAVILKRYHVMRYCLIWNLSGL
jgi:hypothetical protein